ncbi:hypothetical protein MNV49_005223 [Pseudohyphozyma bogoriensis]|nr:hypothetical protein MNV49_005223 [Pseudohyphozyma bogoriensis]
MQLKPSHCFRPLFSRQLTATTTTTSRRRPYGSPDDYFVAREAGENYIRAEGYDLESAIEVPVAWGDQDRYKHVNNVHYIKYFESSRLSFMSSLLSELDDPEAYKKAFLGGDVEGVVGIILATQGVRYRRAVNYPDTLMVAGRVTDIKDDRFSMQHICYSLQQKTMTTKLDCQLVTFDYGALRKTNIPKDLRAALQKRLV